MLQCTWHIVYMARGIHESTTRNYWRLILPWRHPPQKQKYPSTQNQKSLAGSSVTRSQCDAAETASLGVSAQVMLRISPCNTRSLTHTHCRQGTTKPEGLVWDQSVVPHPSHQRLVYPTDVRQDLWLTSNDRQVFWNATGTTVFQAICYAGPRCVEQTSEIILTLHQLQFRLVHRTSSHLALQLQKRQATITKTEKAAQDNHINIPHQEKDCLNFFHGIKLVENLICEHKISMWYSRRPIHK